MPHSAFHANMVYVGVARLPTVRVSKHSRLEADAFQFYVNYRPAAPQTTRCQLRYMPRIVVGTAKYILVAVAIQRHIRKACLRHVPPGR